MHEREVGTEQNLLGAAQLYREARARTDLDIPQLNHLLRIQPYDPSPARALIDRCESLAYPYQCTFGKAELQIDAGVFPPTMTSASPFLLEHLKFGTDGTMLDAFAGSGAFGINAALEGMRVVGFDTSVAAIQCARANAIRNTIEHATDYRVSSIDTCLEKSETFDLIVANPPLIPQAPGSGLEPALFDDGLQATQDFIIALPDLLAKSGSCYLLSSDVIDRQGSAYDILAQCRSAGLTVQTVAQLHKTYESYRVHRIKHKRLRWLPGVLLKAYV